MNKNFLFFIFSLCLLFISIFFMFYGIDIKNIFLSNSMEHLIFFRIRLPRVIASIAVGCGLAVVGCVLQSIFLNPLCDGYTLGISSSAALGVILVTLLNLPFSKFFGSFIGIIFSLILVLILIKTFRKTIDVSFVLSGIMLNFFFSSVIIFLTVVFDPYRLHYILLWLLGSFSSLEEIYTYVVCFLIFVGMILALVLSDKLDIIILGREKSFSLGVDEQKIKLFFLILVIFISALCVSLVGVISFVGIIVPNFVKLFVRLRHKIWILYSTIVGGIFVLFCDSLAKNLFSPIELPISAITGLVGSIFLTIYIVKKDLPWKS